MKIYIFCSLILILLFAPIVSFSASDIPIKKQKKVAQVPPNPNLERYKSELEIKIDKIENECMENNETQMGMNDCAGKSLVAWDKALNDIYGKLMKKLDNKAKFSLKNSQKEWLKYRDNHFKFLEAYYEKFDGSMYVGMFIKNETEIVRGRTLTLLFLLELMELGLQTD